MGQYVLELCNCPLNMFVAIILLSLIPLVILILHMSNVTLLQVVHNLIPEQKEILYIQ